VRYKKQLEDSIDFTNEQKEKEQDGLDEQKKPEAETGETARNGCKRVKVEDEPKKPFNRKDRVSVVKLSSSEDDDSDISSSSSFD
jgi:hypothetical protein